MSYAGDVNCRECWDLLSSEPKAQLIDVRTSAEWNFVGVPELASLGREPILIEWQRYPDMAVTTWFGFAGPAGLPAPVTQQMNEAIGAALDNPKVGGRLVGSGFELDRKSPAALAAYIKDELAKWAPLAKRLIAADGAK